MTRFFFHVRDASDYVDLQGTELPDVAAARQEAVRFAGALLVDGAAAFWDSSEWQMRVQDAAGVTLFELTFSANDGANSSLPGSALSKEKATLASGDASESNS